MARWVIYEEAIDAAVDGRAILRRVAEDIVEDAKRLAPVRTGRLRESIRVAEVDDRRAVVVADARNPDSSPENAAYAGWVERGTSDTPAQPFMRRAGYRYRTP